MGAIFLRLFRISFSERCSAFAVECDCGFVIQGVAMFQYAEVCDSGCLGQLLLFKAAGLISNGIAYRSDLLQYLLGDE